MDALASSLKILNAVYNLIHPNLTERPGMGQVSFDAARGSPEPPQLGTLAEFAN